jgi:hypothetical protein
VLADSPTFFADGASAPAAANPAVAAIPEPADGDSSTLHPAAPAAACC